MSDEMISDSHDDAASDKSDAAKSCGRCVVLLTLGSVYIPVAACDPAKACALQWEQCVLSAASFTDSRSRLCQEARPRFWS